MPIINIVYGDLLQQPVDVIVNAWNRNFIPWWLLLPQGVSGAIKKQAGYAPFRALSKYGMLSIGQAVLTEAGKLPYKGIIHVAGINAFWCATEDSIRKSVQSALILAEHHHFRSIAFPLIGAGTGGFDEQQVQRLIEQTICELQYDVDVFIVIFKK
mgnify:FL=1|jgi:O-acetyl-ADP-ribose deacetylase (regulator of RNase III)